MKLFLTLVVSLSCTHGFEILKNTRHFEANFTQKVRSGDFVYKNYSGHLWYSDKKVKIVITVPDTEYVLIKDSTVKTLIPKDSTLIIQKRLRNAGFFFDMLMDPDRMDNSNGDCVATIFPDSSNIDSLKVFFSPHTVKKVTLYQGEIVVDISISGFKVHSSLPDSIFQIPHIAGIHTVRF